MSAAVLQEQRSNCEEIDLGLAEKAERFHQIVEKHVVRDDGMIPMLLHPDDYRFPNEKDFEHQEPCRHLLGHREADIGMPPAHVWWAWENTAADTGFYLGAMSFRYRCTGASRDLSVCRRSLGALKKIYDFAVQRGETGFLCKPYGGEYSRQTSPDQVQCVTMGLMAYVQIAPREDLQVIKEMVVGFADHWIQNQYACLHGYFAHPSEPGKNPNWSYAMIYIPLLDMAWRFTGDEKYLREIEEWIEACDLDMRLGIGKDTFKVGFCPRMMYLPSVMMDILPQHAELWCNMLTYYHKAFSYGLQEDGTVYRLYEVDPQDGRVTPKGAKVPPCRFGRSAIYSIGLARGHHWVPDEGLRDTCHRLLTRLEVDSFRYWLPPEPGGEIPENWEIKSKLLDMDGLISWQFGYWEGRWRGYW